MARHHVARLFQHGPVSGYRRIDRSLSRFHHTLADAHQIVGQSRCHIIDVENALVGIADDRTIVVVGSHDDKARLTHIENVIAGLSPFGNTSLHKVQIHTLP